MCYVSGLLIYAWKMTTGLHRLTPKNVSFGMSGNIPIPVNRLNHNLFTRTKPTRKIAHTEKSAPHGNHGSHEKRSHRKIAHMKKKYPNRK